MTDPFTPETIKLLAEVALGVVILLGRWDTQKAKKDAKEAKVEAGDANTTAQVTKAKVDRAETDMDEIGFRNGDRGLDWFRQMRHTQNLARDLERRLRQMEDALVVLMQEKQEKGG